MTTPTFDRRAFLRFLLLNAGYSLTAGSALLGPLVHAIGKVPKKLPPEQSIFTLSGKVKINGQQAKSNSKISPTDEIETDSNSQLIFVVGKDAHLVRENTKLTLTEQSNKLETGLNLVQGKVLSVFGKRQGGEQHTINTTTATIGIRGTGVYAESHDDHSYVCTCYGQTQLQAKQDASSKENISTQYHDSPRFILADGKQGKLITPAPVFNHTDEELMLIEALVGRTPPFSSLKSYQLPRRQY